MYQLFTAPSTQVNGLLDEFRVALKIFTGYLAPFSMWNLRKRERERKQCRHHSQTNNVGITVNLGTSSQTNPNELFLSGEADV